MEQNERFRYLFSRYAEKKYSAAEKEELFGMISTSEYDGILEQLVGERWKMTIPEWTRENEDKKADAIFQAVLERVKVKKLFTFKRIAVAASIALILGLGSYLLFFNKSAKPDEIVKATVPGDVKAPETNRAMVTLADGRTVYLDSANNGQLALQGNVKLVKLSNGQIAYEGSSTSLSVTYNTLSNPRGSKVIDMTLADGSRVWLNAGSSVTYPVAFVSNERKVSITGEAYFEVAHNSAMPFKVGKGDMEVTVLGTHFNVNSYDDESDIRVTLLEGSVKVKNGISDVFLKPGQQAKITNEVSIVNDVNIDQVMAWKNGLFNFDNTDIKTLMRQIARWYDVEIEYQGVIQPRYFKGEIERNVPVSKVLQILEFAGIHFRIDGKKIVVMP